MRKLVSPWKDHLINFYEYKKLCGYKYDSTEYVLVMFDQYYANLKIEDMLFSRDIIESKQSTKILKIKNSPYHEYKANNRTIFIFEI